MPDCVFGTRLRTHVILIYDRSCARTRICERLNYAKEVAVETTAEFCCVADKLPRYITCVHISRKSPFSKVCVNLPQMIRIFSREGRKNEVVLILLKKKRKKVDYTSYPRYIIRKSCRNPQILCREFRTLWSLIKATSALTELIPNIPRI